MKSLAAAGLLLFLFIMCGLLFQPANAHSFSTVAISQNEFQNIKQRRLKKSIEVFQKALSERDYIGLLDLLYLPEEFEAPKNRSNAERRKKELAIIKQVFEQTAFSGMTFKIKLGQSQPIISVNKNLFSIVPQNTVISVSENSGIKDDSGNATSGGEYTGSGYYIAISKDKGKTWKFWDGFLIGSFKSPFPEVAKKIKFPEARYPSFVK